MLALGYTTDAFDCKESSDKVEGAGLGPNMNKSFQGTRTGDVDWPLVTRLSSMC